MLGQVSDLHMGSCKHNSPHALLMENPELRASPSWSSPPPKILVPTTVSTAQFPVFPKGCLACGLSACRLGWAKQHRLLALLTNLPDPEGAIERMVGAKKRPAWSLAGCTCEARTLAWGLASGLGPGEGLTCDHLLAHLLCAPWDPW